MLNVFGTNDKSAKDELKLYIYSDIAGQMYPCGQYDVAQGGLVNFRGLEVPCQEYLTMNLQELDVASNDGYSMRISCSGMASVQSYDFKIPGGDLKYYGGFIKKITEWIDKLGFTKEPITATVVFLTDFAVDVAGAFFDEKDALYSLQVELLDKEVP